MMRDALAPLKRAEALVRGYGRRRVHPGLAGTVNAEPAQAPGRAVARGLRDDLIGGSFVQYLNTRPQLVIVGERLKLRILFFEWDLGRKPTFEEFHMLRRVLRHA